MKLFKVIQTSFDNFDTNVRGYLSKAFGNLGMQYTHNQVFGIVYDGIKNILQNVMFYIEDAMTEQNIETAVRKKSVVSLAKLSGYEAYYGAAATGTVDLSVKINNGLSSEYSLDATKTPNKIYIKNGTTIINQNTGYHYIVNLPTNYYVIDVTQSMYNYRVNIIQGKYVSAQFTANGYNLEKMDVNAVGLFDSNYIEVYVDGELWSQVSNLYEMTTDSNEYVLQIGYNSSFSILFGNGVYGKRLNKGQNVFVRYINHEGDSGNINQDTTADFSFYESGSDEMGNKINLNDFVRISNNSFVTGGTNADTIEMVRSMVGYNSRSSVLANEDNFKIFFKRFSFVGNLNVWSERNSMTISTNITRNPSYIKNIDYFDIQPSDILLSQKEKDIILDVLNKSHKTFAGVTVDFVDPIVRKYAIICYIKCNKQFNSDVIKTQIKTSIADYLKVLPINTTFISKTDIIKKVTDEVEGIVYFDFTFISDTAEQCFYNGYYMKYDTEYKNGTFIHSSYKVFYEKNKNVGLDDYGNIQLDSKLEIPLVCGGFSYYSDKTNKNQSIKIDGINIVYI